MYHRKKKTMLANNYTTMRYSHFRNTIYVSNLYLVFIFLRKKNQTYGYLMFVYLIARSTGIFTFP